MKDLLKIKLFLLCVIALCLLSYKMGQNSNEPKETNENTIYLNPAD